MATATPYRALLYSRVNDPRERVRTRRHIPATSLTRTGNSRGLSTIHRPDRPPPPSLWTPEWEKHAGQCAGNGYHGRPPAITNALVPDLPVLDVKTDVEPGRAPMAVPDPVCLTGV